MASPITGYQINTLADVQAPLSGLSSGYFEVEMPLGPVAGGYINLRLSGDRLAQWLQAASGGSATLSEAAFVALATDNQLGTYALKTLLITSRAGGKGNIVVQILGNGAIAYDDAYEFDPANNDAPALPVSLAVSGGAVVAVPRTSGVWTPIGDPANNNRVLGPLPPSTTYGTNSYANEFGPDHSGCAYGAGHYANTFGADHNLNTYGINLAYSSFGPGQQDHNTYGDYFAYGNLRGRVSYCSFGDHISYLTMGGDCRYVQVGDDCERVEVYNCQGTELAPFVIPDGTLDAVYRNGLKVFPIDEDDFGTHPALPMMRDFIAYTLGGIVPAPPPSITDLEITPE